VKGRVLVIGSLEASRPISIDTEDVVVDQQMIEAQFFDGLGKIADDCRIVADLGLGKDDADLHC
jgi:hypothetical protein